LTTFHSCLSAWELKTTLVSIGAVNKIHPGGLARHSARGAIASGELKRGTDTELLIDALNGPLFFRWLQGHTPLEKSFAERIFDKVILGFQR
jgi:hypothetical protein